MIDAPVEVLAVVAAELSCEFPDFDADKFRSSTGLVHFFAPDHRARIVTPPGLVPRITGLAAAHGWPVTVDDRRLFPAEFAADGNVRRGLVGRDAAVADAVIANPLGRLIAKDDFDLVRAIGTICRLFPKLQILVMVRTMRPARQLWRGLRQDLGHDVQLAHGEWTKHCRIVVSTYAYMTDPTEWQIVLLPELSTITAEGVLDRIDCASGRRHFGVADGLPIRVYAMEDGRKPARRGRRAMLAVEAAAGPVIYIDTAAARDARRAFVAWCPLGTPVRTRGLDGLALKRTLYWHNEARNQLLAKVAEAAADASEVGLGQVGVTVVPDLLDRLPAQPRVVVIVESTEHLAHLMPLLSDRWQRRDLAGGPGHWPGLLTVVTLAFARRGGGRRRHRVGRRTHGVRRFPDPRQFPAGAPHRLQGRHRLPRRTGVTAPAVRLRAARLGRNRRLRRPWDRPRYRRLAARPGAGRAPSHCRLSVHVLIDMRYAADSNAPAAADWFTPIRGRHRITAGCAFPGR